MVVLDDVLEMHSTIRALEERQRTIIRLAQEFMKEAESIGDVIETLRHDYEALKQKAKEE
ncbi:hypothetical protein NYE69_27140 [Paenibacillus sp. FSL R5-0527]|uniref:hypothetical protein n=1 Tax=Paenibacillus sp. FSL R5-0527 TaxID=2975321 RepID=UPI00097A74C6|nr:hypothetical protein BK140_22345 [Paenibacillus macerans]